MERTTSNRCRHQLQVLLQQLISKQPNDPITYICNHLQHLVSSPPSPVETAVRVMVECAGGDHTQDEDIIYSAFELLGDEDPDLVPVVFTGIPQNHYQRFMSQLTRHIDVPGSDKLKHCLLRQDSLIVSYAEFTSKAKLCLLFMRYLNVCKDIYHQLDTRGTGEASNDAVSVLLSTLTESISSLEQSQRIAVKLPSTENDQMKTSQGECTTVSYEEFQHKAVDIFINYTCT